MSEEIVPSHALVIMTQGRMTDWQSLIRMRLDAKNCRGTLFGREEEVVGGWVGVG